MTSKQNGQLTSNSVSAVPLTLAPSAKLVNGTAVTGQLGANAMYNIARIASEHKPMPANSTPTTITVQTMSQPTSVSSAASALSTTGVVVTTQIQPTQVVITPNQAALPRPMVPAQSSGTAVRVAPHQPILIPRGGVSVTS